MVKLVLPARRRILLICGIASSLLYAVMNVVVPTQWEGYNSASRVISELSAIGAPSRQLWIALGIAYAALLTAFGWGIWLSARGNRPLRVVGGLMIVYGAINLIPWPPMHQREVLAAGGATLTDTLHILWSMGAVLFMMLAMGFGAAAFGTQFRRYTVASMLTLVIFGALTGIDAPRLQLDLPTPLIGVWERINIGIFLLWVVVLAITLLRRSPLDQEKGPTVQKAIPVKARAGLP